MDWEIAPCQITCRICHSLSCERTADARLAGQCRVMVEAKEGLCCAGVRTICGCGELRSSQGRYPRPHVCWGDHPGAVRHPPVLCAAAAVSWGWEQNEPQHQTMHAMTIVDWLAGKACGANCSVQVKGATHALLAATTTCVISKMPLSHWSIGEGHHLFEHFAAPREGRVLMFGCL